MDRRNRAGQLVQPGRRNSQGKETNKSFGLVDEILKAKRRSAGGRAGRAGQGGQIKSKR